MKALKKTVSLLLILAAVMAVAVPGGACAYSAEASGCVAARYLPARPFCGNRLAEAQRVVDCANMAIDGLVRVAIMTPWDDVAWLLVGVDAIVAGVMAYARTAGVTIACEYERYYIDGRVVMIDPLRVINV